MSVPGEFEALVGAWKGSNRLHMSWNPDNPVNDSESTATISTAANGKFLKIAYDWHLGAERHEGEMTLCVGEGDNAEISWFDSFHSSGGFLISKGAFADGKIDAMGHYSVPGHPEWGWRTIIESTGDNEWSFTMYNVSPEGEEYIAVESAFSRS